MKVHVDLAALTLGDLIDLEDAGGSLADMQSAKTIVAMVWLMRRREDPTFTLADARNVSVADLDITVVDGNGAADPKGGVSLTAVEGG